LVGAHVLEDRVEEAVHLHGRLGRACPRSVAPLVGLGELVAAETAGARHGDFGEAAAFDEREVFQRQADGLFRIGAVGYGAATASPALGLDEVHAQRIAYRFRGTIELLCRRGQGAARVVGDGVFGSLDRPDLVALARPMR
jgi:hypothetical protein